MDTLNYLFKRCIRFSTGIIKSPVFTISAGEGWALNITTHCNYDIYRRNICKQFGILCRFHINIIKMFHQSYSILVDSWFCFCSGRIAFKHIGSKLSAQCFCNLAAAGIMHTDKCYFRFRQNENYPLAFCRILVTSSLLSTLPKETTLPSTTSAGVVITP